MKYYTIQAARKFLIPPCSRSKMMSLIQANELKAVQIKNLIVLKNDDDKIANTYLIEEKELIRYNIKQEKIEQRNIERIKKQMEKQKKRIL